MTNFSRQEYFKRQTTLAEFGEQAQQKLANAKVLVVGCGGLGGTIAVHLATSGIGALHLVDFDSVSVSNLHRQVFFSSESVGSSKPKTLAENIQSKTPFCTVTFDENPLRKSNVLETIEVFDVVVDATDSLPTKYLLNDACVLKNKPLVYGSLYKFDGYMASFNLLENGTRTANLRDAFPKQENNIPNCEEAGTLNAIVGVIAMLQVNEVLKIVAEIGKPLANELLIYNSLENTQFKMKLTPKSAYKWSLSEEKQSIAQIFEQETYFDASCQVQQKDWLITPELLTQAQENMPNVEVISVIENPPKDYPIKVDTWLPLSKLQAENFAVDSAKMYVFVCNKGVTSYRATQLLRQAHPEKAIFSLVGGIDVLTSND